ncbi:NUDIX domain-containing protein [Prolixibacteraceae bacterium JC049]|nr:NUDIX domain-containing protein [Prolixibacteraceae bacterium JC049]
MIKDPTHPRTVLRYCQKCGKEVQFDSQNFKSVCDHCGFQFYINSAAAVAAVIESDNGQVLFAVRGREPFIGMLDLPGGFIDVGETAENALMREINEELGANVTSSSYLGSFPNEYSYGGLTYYTLDLAYRCKVESLDNLKAQDDISGWEFHNLKEMDLELIGSTSMKNIVRFLQNE